jgi:hypothetical protein
MASPARQRRCSGTDNSILSAHKTQPSTVAQKSPASSQQRTIPRRSSSCAPASRQQSSHSTDQAAAAAPGGRQRLQRNTSLPTARNATAPTGSHRFCSPQCRSASACASQQAAHMADFSMQLPEPLDAGSTDNSDTATSGKADQGTAAGTEQPEVADVNVAPHPSESGTESDSGCEGCNSGPDA